MRNVSECMYSLYGWLHIDVTNKIQNINDLEYEPGVHCLQWFCANLSWN